MGGLIPAGGPVMPGGGAPRPLGGGGPPTAWWALGWGPCNTGCGGNCSSCRGASCGVITCREGPLTPQTGPASPAGAWGMGTPAGIPLPAALRIPGPPASPASGPRVKPISLEGGPFIVIETRFSPRSSTRPKTLLFLLVLSSLA